MVILWCALCTQNMSTPVLYYLPYSPPCHLVLLVAKRLNIELELVDCHPYFGNCPEKYYKVNPTLTVPALDDNGFHLPESRAIAFYLLEQYGKDDPLLPKDPKSRALVLQRLIFDEDLWIRTFRSCVRPIYFDNKFPTDDVYEKLDEGLEFLNTFLEDNEWLAGEEITLADYSTVATVNYISTLNLTDLKKFPHVYSWFERAKDAIKDYDEIVTPHNKTLQDFYHEKTTKLKEQQQQ